MEKISTKRINEEIKLSESDFIKKCEKNYSDQITEIAVNICDQSPIKPVLFLAGPSGAGKTTTALRLENLLDNFGHETHTLSLDDYFIPHSGTSKEVDFESPERLDFELLHKHLEAIANCEEIVVPGFNFRLQERFEKGTLKRKPGEIIVVEGIHALNPLVTGENNNYSNNIYVSVRTRITDKQGISFHPSKIRLLRRIMRDTKFRGKSIDEVFEQFKSVERGENLYISPFKENSHFEINTFMAYELSAYKDQVLPLIIEASKTYKDYTRFESIEKILLELNSVKIDDIPRNSLVREFYGDSELKY